MRFGPALLIGAALLAPMPAPAGADELSRQVDTGRVVVDGRWIDAPFPLQYTTSPPGVAAASVPVQRDDELIELLELRTIPPTVTVGGGDLMDGRRRTRPASPPARVALGALADHLVTFVLERLRAGDDAASIERALGAFLLDTPDVVAAEVGESTIRIEASLEETWVLELPRLDDARLARIRAHVERRLDAVVAAARVDAIYEDGVAYLIDSEGTRNLVRALLAAGGTDGAVAWMTRALGGTVPPDVAGRAIHAHVAATRGRDAAEAAMIERFPAGPDGVWVLADETGRVALACRDVELARLPTRLRNAGVSVQVPYGERDRRVTFYSSGFLESHELLAELARSCALVLRDTEGGDPELRDDFPIDLTLVEREGQPLWHVASPATSADWLAVGTARLLAPVRLGGVRAYRWRTGGVAWQHPGPPCPGAWLVHDEEELLGADADGAVVRLRVDDGRVRWGRHLEREIPTLGSDAAFRGVAISDRVLLVAEGDERIVSIDRDRGRVVRSDPMALRVPEGALPRDARVFTLDGRVIAAERGSGEIRAVRAVDAPAGARTTAVRDGWLLERHGELVRLDERLEAIGRIPLARNRAWAARDEHVVVGGDGSYATVYRTEPGADGRRIPLPARPTAAFAADGSLYVACTDGNTYRVDEKRARVVAVLEGLDVPARAAIAVQGVGVFHAAYGAALAGHRVR